MPVISRLGWPARAVLAILLASAFSLSSFVFSFASGGPAIKQISSDPYTNSSSQHKTQTEPDTFSYGSTIVSTFQSGRFPDGGSSNVGWATSTDSGKTWKRGFLPGTTIYATPKGPYDRDTDPAVTYDAAHKTWLIVNLALTGTTGIAALVSRSTDGGLTWSNPVTVHKGTGGDFLDKNWIVCDNTSTSKFYGHCYVEFDLFSQGDLIQLSTSTDGGAKWSTPQSTADSAHGLGGQPLVQPNGRVIVPEDNGFEGGFLAFTSSDGGKSWSNSVNVTTFNKSPVLGDLRAPDLISAEIDKAGKVYVVWYDCSFRKNCSSNDIVMSTTTDGKKWSKTTRIPTDALNSGADHFIPGIAVDKSTSGSSAHIGVAFYFYPVGNCNSSTCKLEVGYISSTNGGKTWSKTVTVTPRPMSTPWLASTNQGYMVGDYISTSFLNGKAYPAFAYAIAPSKGMFHESIYTVASGLDVTGGDISSANDRVVASRPTVFTLQRAN